MDAKGLFPAALVLAMAAILIALIFAAPDKELSYWKYRSPCGHELGGWHYWPARGLICYAGDDPAKEHRANEGAWQNTQRAMPDGIEWIMEGAHGR